MDSITAELVRALLPRRDPGGHKGTFGKVCVYGGCVGYTGAPVYAGEAAARTGSGLVYVGVPAEIYPIAAARCAAAMACPVPEAYGELLAWMSRCDAALIGPGLGRAEGTARAVRALLADLPCPVVLDADGINALEGHIDVLDIRKGLATILTPHDGEFARIGGDTSGGRVQAARDFALEHGCFLVLKGHRTVTATPSATVLVNTTGNSGLAKGGSGDLLTGLIAALLAQGASPGMAAAGAVWLHGRAGDLAAARLTEYCVTPEDVLASLPEAFLEITK